MAFPNDDYVKARTSKAPYGPSITKPICFEFRDPEIPISFWHGGFDTSGVLMPIAAMDEDGPAPSLVRKVGSTRQRSDVQAIDDPKLA